MCYICDMKRGIIIGIICLLSTVLYAQKVVVSGTVIDEQTGKRIPQASVSEVGSSVSVVTNDDGFFTIKLEGNTPAVTISHLGYQSRRVNIAKEQTEPLRVRLKPTAIELKEVVVWTQDARKLVDLAIQKIPQNYSSNPELFNCFYRETAMKRQHYIYVAEGIVDMYKTPYNKKSSFRDRVAITKGRRLLSPKRGDTLSVKVIGGPVQPVKFDLVKNLDFLFNEAELNNYTFAIETSTVIDGRPQFVVSIAPYKTQSYALFRGHLYIDCETLSFTRTELSLDMSDKNKATNSMLVHKPLGVRFKPKEMTMLVDYKFDNGVTRISYIRSTFRFNCDWKRRLLATSFTAFCEMVVTDRVTHDVHPIQGNQSFDQRDAFYDRVDYFRDPDFWADYNIIEPTETLDQAIGKLLKKYKN